jgi:hypothetical protein
MKFNEVSKFAKFISESTGMGFKESFEKSDLFINLKNSIYSFLKESHTFKTDRMADYYATKQANKIAGSVLDESNTMSSLVESSLPNVRSNMMVEASEDIDLWEDILTESNLEERLGMNGQYQEPGFLQQIGDNIAYLWNKATTELGKMFGDIGQWISKNPEAAGIAAAVATAGAIAGVIYAKKRAGGDNKAAKKAALQKQVQYMRSGMNKVKNPKEKQKLNSKIQKAEGRLQKMAA